MSIRVTAARAFGRGPGASPRSRNRSASGRETVRRTWLFDLLLAAVAAALYVTTVGKLNLATPVVQLPWILLASLFCMAEAWRVYVHLRRNAISFSLSELPLVLGLFFASPRTLVSARIAGGRVVALWLIRRSPADQGRLQPGAVQPSRRRLAMWLLSVVDPCAT